MSDRIKQTGEVFTPIPLVARMLQRLPKEIWFDPAQTFLDNSAGDGNFLFAAKRILMAGLEGAFLDPIERERHILENMLFAVEIMPDNVERLQGRLGWSIAPCTPDPKLDPDHFRWDMIDHRLPFESADPVRGDFYFHHRNVVCADALDYDYAFGR